MSAHRAVAAAALVFCAACGKKASDAPPSAVPDATASAPATPALGGAPADSTDEQREAAKKQALMEYATMEDTYMNDPAAQWAATATASSTFGDEDGREPSPTNLASNATGVVDGKTWTNNRQDLGFDWLEATFAKPMNATEVRIVFENGDGIEAISKLELLGTDGAWNTVWSGVSDQKKDPRGQRSWFVRSFAKTPYQVKAVKLTVANAVQRGYKVVDAVQLVGN